MVQVLCNDTNVLNFNLCWPYESLYFRFVSCHVSTSAFTNQMENGVPGIKNKKSYFAYVYSFFSVVYL